MAGVLDFNQYLGGPDEVKVEQIFPSNQKTLIYDFHQPITGWKFSTDYQTLVVDQVQFNRRTGEPNFSSSIVIGSFDKVDITGSDKPYVIDSDAGQVKVFIPANMYQGPILPDARVNVPVTVHSLTWEDNNEPAQINSHRFAFVQAWEPDVVVGDPITDSGDTPLTLG